MKYLNHDIEIQMAYYFWENFFLYYYQSYYLAVLFTENIRLAGLFNVALI